MSHFSGLVIITPDCKLSVEECLAKYDENVDVPEYISGEVTDFDKICFLEYYYLSNKGDDIREKFINTHKNNEGYKTIEEYKTLYPYNWSGDNDNTRFRVLTVNDHRDDFIAFFKEECAELFNDFDNKYAEKGDNWNSSRWRINPETNKWCEYSTYNPNSKWDWYVNGGRWNCTIKTKTGELVNECLLGEIDWSPFKPEDYCKTPKKDWKGEKYYPLKKKVQWHHTTDTVPFCVVINGEWHEKAEMGYWAITTNEKENWGEIFAELIKDLPENSECYLMDFHI